MSTLTQLHLQYQDSQFMSQIQVQDSISIQDYTWSKCNNQQYPVNAATLQPFSNVVHQCAEFQSSTSFHQHYVIWTTSLVWNPIPTNNSNTPWQTTSHHFLPNFPKEITVTNL